MNTLLKIVTLVATLTVFSVGAQEPLLIRPGESIAGATQREWSERWWQWAFSFERARSPIADRTGAFCASRQSGKVWFLAGTYGSHRVERECTVPFGKTLFFPLVNYVTFRAEGSSESCMSLAGRAAALAKDPSALILDINGRRYEGLKAHRFATRCFSVVPGQAPDSVADGYFVAVRPLARGQHVVNFGGVLADMAQAVTYRITVE